MDVVKIGKGLTLTLILSLLEQLLISVPVTIYSVRVVGYTIGFEIVLLLMSLFGIHRKLSAPITVSCTESPIHIVSSCPASITGKLRVLTVTVSWLLQLFKSVPVKM